MSSFVQRLVLGGAAVCFGLGGAPKNANAWGDEGHEVVALVAYHFLDPTAKAKVDAILAADTDSLTAHDIASEATWADKYRESHRRTGNEHYGQTSKWHYVDTEQDRPDIDAACYGHPSHPIWSACHPGSRGRLCGRQDRRVRSGAVIDGNVVRRAARRT